MTIPERLRRDVSARELAEYVELCHRIEQGVIAHDDVSEPLAQWNRRAGRSYTATDFTTYYGAVETETFVRSALLGPARRIDDLEISEAEALLGELLAGVPSESDTDYYLALLEANLPGSNIIDLVYNPAAWFELPRIDVQLSAAQVLRYAMDRSGRELLGTPVDIDRPIPMPGSDAHRAIVVGHAWSLARRWAQARAEKRFSDAKAAHEELQRTMESIEIPELAGLEGCNGDALTQRMIAVGLWPG